MVDLRVRALISTILTWCVALSQLQRTSLQVDEPQLGGTATEAGAVKSNEDEENVTTYKEAMVKIKEATGVSDVQEVVCRFLSQGDTKAHLEQLKGENNEQRVKLREEKVEW